MADVQRVALLEKRKFAFPEKNDFLAVLVHETSHTSFLSSEKFAEVCFTIRNLQSETSIGKVQTVVCERF